MTHQVSVLHQDKKFDVSLRPKGLKEFCGQAQLTERLELFLNAAIQRGEVPGHCLFLVLRDWGKPHSLILWRTQ